jgi:hypothetical protein
MSSTSCRNPVAAFHTARQAAVQPSATTFPAADTNVANGLKMSYHFSAGILSGAT